jgi:hypothetical protein
LEETSGGVSDKDFRKIQQNSTILLYNNFVVYSFALCVGRGDHYQAKPIQKYITQGKITVKRDASVVDNSAFLYVVVMPSPDDGQSQ